MSESFSFTQPLFLSSDDLFALWNLTHRERSEALKTEAQTKYAMQVSPHFAQCVRECRDEALLREVLPAAEELAESPGFTENPLQEEVSEAENQVPICLLQKYSGRALLITATQCFGNCRFCFRRHLRTIFPSKNLRREDFQSAISRVSRDDSIHEIIFSGGDPLTLQDDLFFWLLFQFKNIAHIKRIRVHTRAPIFCPERISEYFSELLKLFSEHSEKPIYFVLHVNHPDELSPESTAAIERLHSAGVTLLQQGVLLRGINDRVEILAELYEKLTEHHVIPYYLHQLDRVAGASHFEVDTETGVWLIQELRTILPGFAVPRYAREIPGEKGKTILE